MKTYATRQDMIDSFGEDEVVRLTDTRDEPGVIDDATLLRALERTSVDIDGYISTRYPRPFPETPRLLIGVCCDMARYRLCGTGGRLVTEEVRDRHKDAIKLLGMVASGQVKLGLDVVDQPVDWGGGVQRTQGSTVLADALKDY